MKKIVIAVDGHSSCGKSTMAKELARQIGYTYVDSGAMYRAVTLYAIENGFFEDGELKLDQLKDAIDAIRITFRRNEQTLQQETYLNGRNVEKEIRRMDVADKVSPIAAISFVRKEMVRQQQAMGEQKGIVMDGRDVGTVVFPDAELKFFVTASPEVRAQRRLAELKAKGENVSFEEVLDNLNKRDLIDSTRQEGPLRQADDALVLDNSHMTIDEQNQWMLNAFKRTVEQ